jgi:hypothetical protein
LVNAVALNGKTLDVFASSKLVEETRQAVEAAQAELDAFLELTDVLTKDELIVAINPRRAKVERAREAYDAALTEVEETVDLPDSGDGFLALDEQGKRRVARSLIERIVVSPALPGRPITDRFEVHWRNGR